MAREGNGGVSEAGMQIEMFQNKPQLHNEHKDTCCAGVQGVCVCVCRMYLSVAARSVASSSCGICAICYACCHASLPWLVKSMANQAKLKILKGKLTMQKQVDGNEKGERQHKQDAGKHPSQFARIIN